MANEEELRNRIETSLRQSGLLYTVEPNGLYRIPHGSTFVRIGVFNVSKTGATKGGIVKLLAPVAVEITKITPELTRFLCEKNGELLFGKFSLNSKNKAIFYEHTLFGDALNRETLTAALALIVGTADEYDEKIANMAGGKRVRDLR